MKRRALRWLAQREHSRAELRVKLLSAARRLTAEGGAHAAAASGIEAEVEVDTEVDTDVGYALGRATRTGPCPSVADLVDRVLDRLTVTGLLCDARVAETRIHVRSARYGVQRIEAELNRLGVSATAEALDRLRSTEVDRARAVWARRYGTVATDATERARQMRFLAGRGFSGDTIRRVMAAGALCEPGEPDDDTDHPGAEPWHRERAGD